MTRDQITAAIKEVTWRAKLAERPGVIGAKVPPGKVEQVRQLLSSMRHIGVTVIVIPLNWWQRITLWRVVWAKTKGGA